ncbi:plasmid partitioning protein RepB [Phyllobacterium myrsinacearum]|uniref:ParB family chromosome partitioning protein n=1 Tax=Phyllobacterium myrsinacearum TaxID=28101 RepID=A0A839EXZ5_9HYPH|nr:plasmid partitioning protein RepB [Phyllobacterium myrsinacearum]MBA8882156.1 ParB family chromosome partitioning protein [Phyllobacterium myrsinacearum]
MARKNLFEMTPESADPETAAPVRTTLGRPLLGLDRPLRPASPVGAISQSLDGISAKAQRAEEIEKRLAAGQAIIELDPSLIDASFIVDRLGIDADDQSGLVAQIREHGQQVPILVRPHPESEGRFQVAYGHRRLAAIKEIGGTVRAVVRDLTDEQLIVSQGQENNARTDLSFIERCYFATKLEARGFSRETIMSSLGVDKAALSRMIALVKRVPPPLIEAIGPAPAFGRQRWAEIADMLEDKAKCARLLKHIEDTTFLAAKSDARFQIAFDLLKITKDKPRLTPWTAPDGTSPVKIKETDTALNIAFDKRDGSQFGAFVERKLLTLFEEFRKETGD